eukprot:scaffold3953_cov236-Pinguiococcus_pyrenoidosus.AAC.6
MRCPRPPLRFTEPRFRRETYEELGISPEHITTLGFCETIPAVTGTMVTPVIGLLKPDLTDVPLTLSEDEVETVFTLPIRALLSDALLEMRKYENRGTLPVFHGADHEVRASFPLASCPCSGPEMTTACFLLVATGLGFDRDDSARFRGKLLEGAASR